MNIKSYYDTILNHMHLDARVNEGSFSNSSSLKNRVGDHLKNETYDMLLNKIKQEDPEDYSFIFEFMGMHYSVDVELGTNKKFLKMSNYG